MGLKDISKIVANQTALEKAEETRPVTSPRVEQYKNIKPGTNKPVDVSRHVGFKFNSENPTHMHLLKTMMSRGQDLTVHEGGVVSAPYSVVANKDDKTTSTLFGTAIDTSEGGKEIRFKGEAAKVKPRKSENRSAPSTRPTPPKNPTTTSPVQAVARTVDQDRSAKRLDTPEAIAARNALLRKNRGK